MKLTFLGTAAAQGYPVGWCACRYCEYARAHGGKNVRSASCAMLDDDVLLDLTETGMHNAALLGIPMAAARTLLVTHAHEDHVTPQVLNWRWGKREWETADPEIGRDWFRARFTPVPTLRVFGNEEVIRLLRSQMPEETARERELRLEYRVLGIGESVTDRDLTFTAIASHHGERGACFNYIVSRGGKTLLYATDTGGYDEDMYALLFSRRYDAVVTECTFGESGFPYDGHFTLDGTRAFRAALLAHGCVSPETPFLLTHLSPHWVPPHDLFAPEMAKEGITVAYDGMTLSF